MIISWLILLLSLDLVDSALIVQNTLNRYCDTDAFDIYAAMDNVTQDDTLSTAQAVEKCRPADYAAGFATMIKWSLTPTVCW